MSERGEDTQFLVIWQGIRYTIHMRRTTLILLIVLVVAALGAGAWFWMKRGDISWPWQKANTNAVATSNTAKTNRNTNTVTTNTVLANLPAEVKGTTTATGTLKIGPVNTTINSLQVFSTYSGITPATGKELLVVFIDGLPQAEAAQLQPYLNSVSLKVGKDTIGMHRYKIGTTQIGGDRGFFAFDIPTNTKQATLTSTVAGATSTVDLTLSK